MQLKCFSLTSAFAVNSETFHLFLRGVFIRIYVHIPFGKVGTFENVVYLKRGTKWGAVLALESAQTDSMKCNIYVHIYVCTFFFAGIELLLFLPSPYLNAPSEV